MIKDMEEERKYRVYMHITPNFKKYIGITGQNPIKRWKNGKGYCSNKYFASAIKKYGWENIQHKVLYSCLTKEEAEQKEIELIEYYKSNDSRYGYNLTTGGEIGKRTNKTKRMISYKNRGKRRNQTQKDNIKMGLRMSIGVPVIRLSDKTIYISISEAAEKTGINKQTILNACKNKNNKTWCYYNEYYIKEQLENIPDKYLYEYLLRKNHVEDDLVMFMGGDLLIWKRLTKFDKRYK